MYKPIAKQNDGPNRKPDLANKENQRDDHNGLQRQNGISKNPYYKKSKTEKLD